MGIDMEKCAVCTEVLGLTVVKLNCGHYFHEQCLKKWNLQQSTCPLCRTCFEKMETFEIKRRSVVLTKTEKASDALRDFLDSSCAGKPFVQCHVCLDETKSHPRLVEQCTSCTREYHFRCILDAHTAEQINRFFVCRYCEIPKIAQYGNNQNSFKEFRPYFFQSTIDAHPEIIQLRDGLDTTVYIEWEADDYDMMVLWD